MRKLQKVALVGAVLGSVGSFGVGTAVAHGEAMAHDVDITQGIECRSHDMNIDVLGSLGLVNGALGNALNGEGSPGAQPSHLGSDMGCNSGALK
ncbi:hypothetical protein ACM01_36890 [Streptomyces viridochromogenes]|uniref:Uncharacterized protein n=1 Tax=Streptomyces viridochromogenes TaxID=1938 RepID=A0A0J7YZG7_STRVR|nr:hypothetical protein [Streptomyces viridochromogenes]KMS68974.1 hypothetical protein ACM01_36890 [Streptomyces viridochromogenes]KOG16125.1 hypothetical protein ADK36_28105 [Streptomyces viridochromogenes]KOG16368.1 hypothetical protein ADK35_27070 [Streptomyces viridochromogenes]